VDRAHDVEHRRHLVRAVVASVVGTALEWYDFFLYGSAAALVFPKLFFPNASPYAGALEAFGTYAVGFAARPVGAAFFGRYGDRIGRRKTLMITLVVMGAASAAIGLVPTYDAIGAWAPTLLVALRVVQGLGVGGEWGGSILIAMEWGDKKRRGLVASWPQLGVPIGLMMATGAFALMNAVAPGAAFFAWGWRLPFLSSVALIVIGMAIRYAVRETPEFEALARKKQLAKAPVLEVLRHNRREVVLSALLRLSEQTPFYVFTAFLLDYGTRHLGYARGFLLEATLVASAISLVAVPAFGHLSDVVGRKRIYIAGSVVTALWAVAYFAILDARVPAWAFVAVAVSLVPHNMQYGPQAALIAESFTSRLRYSGAGLGYQLASVVAGGPAPIVSAFLVHEVGSVYAVAAYVALTSVVTVLATRALPAPPPEAQELAIDER
jgi:metabolite-proton symporter